MSRCYLNPDCIIHERKWNWWIITFLYITDSVVNAATIQSRWGT